MERVFSALLTANSTFRHIKILALYLHIEPSSELLEECTN